jgi:hypothetical protein
MGHERGFSGNLVASIPTQRPYGDDWVRDCGQFNHAIDRYLGEGGNGRHDRVEKHNELEKPDYKPEIQKHKHKQP